MYRCRGPVVEGVGKITYNPISSCFLFICLLTTLSLVSFSVDFSQSGWGGDWYVRPTYLISKPLYVLREQHIQISLYQTFLAPLTLHIHVLYTDKKENLVFLIYKENQSGAVAKSYMRKDFLVYEEMRKYFPIYGKAVSHILYDFATAPFTHI